MLWRLFSAESQKSLHRDYFDFARAHDLDWSAFACYCARGVVTQETEQR